MALAATLTFFDMRLTAMERRLDQRIDRVEERMDCRFLEVERRLGAVEQGLAELRGVLLGADETRTSPDPAGP